MTERNIIVAGCTLPRSDVSCIRTPAEAATNASAVASIVRPARISRTCDRREARAAHATVLVANCLEKICVEQQAYAGFAHHLE